MGRKGKQSPQKLATVLKRDRIRYKAMFERSKGLTKQPVQPAKRSIRTKDIIGSRRPIRRRPRQPVRRRRMTCEIQFPGRAHGQKVHGKTLSQLGVYEDVKEANKRYRELQIQ